MIRLHSHTGLILGALALLSATVLVAQDQGKQDVGNGGTVDGEGRITPSTAFEELTVKVHGANASVRGNGFCYEFHRGVPKSMKSHGKEWLLKGVKFPYALNVYRAPVAADRKVAEQWIELGLDKLHPKILDFQISQLESGVARVRAVMEWKGRGIAFHHTSVFTILGDGTLRMDNVVSHDNDDVQLPRVGVQLLLVKDLDHVDYHARGPQENYPDWENESTPGRYTAKVDDFHKAHEKSQSMGSRQDVKWLSLRDKSGKGMVVVMDRGVSMAFSALRFTEKELAAASGISDLKVDAQQDVVLCLDYRQRGIGKGSEKKKLLPEDEITKQSFGFGFVIRPLEAREDPLSKAGELLPFLPAVSIQRDKNGMVTMSCPDDDVEIQYTISNREGANVYDGKPFKLSQAAVVSAVATTTNGGPAMITGPVTEIAFPALIDKSQWKIVAVSGEEKGEGDAGHMLDNDPRTYWHTPWRHESPKHPHHFIVDLGSEMKLDGVGFEARVDNVNGSIRDFEVQVSEDNKNYQRAVNGALENGSGEIMFQRPREARFIKVIVKSEVNGNNWASLAEFSVIPTSPEK